MTISEYTQRLALALGDCSPDEIDNAVQYYTELIEDSDDPEGQMQRLGDPETLAERIKQESGWIQPAEPTYNDGGSNFGTSPNDSSNGGYQTPPPEYYSNKFDQSAKSNGSSALRGALAVLTFPLWFSLIILLASLIIVVWSVYICFPLLTAALLADGLFHIGSYLPFSLAEISSSLIFLGLSVLLVRPAIGLTKLLAKAIKWLVQIIFAPNTLKTPEPEPQKKPKSTAKKFVTAAAAAASAAGVILLTCVLMIAKPTRGSYLKSLNREDVEQNIDISQSIKINVEMGDVTICKSKDGKARLTANNIIPSRLKISDDGETVISYKNDKSHKLSTLSRRTDISFKLYLPEEKITEIIVQNNLGDLTIKNLEASKLDITLNSGDISLFDVKAENIDIDSDLGDITAEKLLADNLTADSSCGSLEFKDAAIKSQAKILLALGDAEIENAVFGRLDAEVNCGDFTFSGELTDSDSEIEMDLGDVDIVLVGDNYSVYANGDLGDVKVDKKFKGSGNRIVNVRNDCGDITVSSD